MTRRGSGRATYGRNNEYENNHHQTQNFTTDPDKIRVLSLYRMGVLLYNVVSERYAQMTSKRKPSTRNKGSEEPTSPQPKRKRGRPEKLVKIDDTPRNVARSFFGIPSDKFTRPKQ